ncbi:MAG: hypothetical protein JJU06_12785 [Ectothiorhodospiraceae bacterium]|nr:hypothetical protein [Ectothiorhodospiraceae bacterium]
MLGKALRTFKREKKYRAELEKSIQDHTSELVSGQFLQEGRIAYRKGIALPEHLKKTKGHNKDSLIYEMAKILARTGKINNNNEGEKKNLFEIIVLTNPDDILLISKENEIVRRYSKNFNFSGNYLTIRKEISKRLPLVSFSISERGDYITEELADGHPLNQESIEKIIEVSNRIIQNSSPQKKFIDSEKNNDEITLRTFFSNEFWAPSHGDLRPQNILVTNRDAGEVKIIDASNLGLHPFWYDGLMLATEAGVRLFAQGAFDGALQHLFRSGGLPALSLTSHRQLVIEAFHRYKKFLRVRRQIEITRHEGWWNKEKPEKTEI